MPENSPYRGILFDLERNIPEPAEEIPPYVSRAGALEEADPDTAFIVLRSAAEDRLTKSLEEIRRSRTLFCVPVLLMSPASAAGSALADGPFTGWSEAARRGAETSELLGTLPTPARDLDQDERLLTYLYCRPEQVLEPLPAYASPLLYRYPLVEAFNTAFPGREHVWLESLLNRGLLEIDSLIDRVRVCPPCREAHLNYVDRCPNCHSVAIGERIFLHCFACGFVAPQESFIQRGALTCPKCRAALRHIGSDYDRALENHLCSDCGHTTEEPQIVARCMSCGRSHSPEELEKRNVARLRLGERGRVAVQAGKVHDIYALFENTNYLAPEFFRQILDWQIEVYDRYQKGIFSLLMISLDNIPELVTRIGRTRTVAQVEEFVFQLRQVIRDTDFSTRPAEGRLLLFLPYTDIAGFKTLKGRIASFEQKFQTEKENGLRFSMAGYCFPEERQEGETSELILARLTQELEKGG